jgi:hypothetical protein
VQAGAKPPDFFVPPDDESFAPFDSATRRDLTARQSLFVENAPNNESAAADFTKVYCSKEDLFDCTGG